ncbi:helix-turn-helix domain-containing protein [Rhodoferax sp. U2-2l]|uniref:helix-turn-helix domain-containing protein n=1 Tax=Rhodoferax sp. U2-2l TaxID=2884000 RepID=UPI001D0A9A19|nr:helix-turn-helix transcriptional regulator [Rhodoferax sp. U2-2l]MCB8748931.1 helix-turn-helix domain-containing protein [Rhodoferax sp. U2-2l]
MARARNEAVIDAFATTLKKIRRQQRMTQEELADKASLDRTFIGLLETGRRQPTLSVICALAYALDETPSQLVKNAVELAEMADSGPLVTPGYVTEDKRFNTSKSDE